MNQQRRAQTGVVEVQAKCMVSAGELSYLRHMEHRILHLVGERGVLGNWLAGLFPEEKVDYLLALYRVGALPDGRTVFPYITRAGFAVGAEGMATLSSTEAKPGERVYLRANPTAGWLFKRWQAAEDDATINAPEAAYTYFLMPAHDVHVTAVFETNAIAPATTDAASAAATLHTLDGRRATQATQGIYILNGRKVLVK